MHHLLIAAAISVAALSTSVSAQIVEQVKYKRWGMFGGYKEKVTGPNSWRVDAGTNGVAPEGSAGRIALYRAAELASSAGFRYFQIVNQKGSQTYLGIGWGAATVRGAGGAQLRIVAVDDPAPPQNCLADRKELCVTLDAQETMQRIAPYLKFPRPK